MEALIGLLAIGVYVFGVFALVALALYLVVRMDAK